MADFVAVHQIGTLAFEDYNAAGFEDMARNPLYKFWVAEVDCKVAGFLVVLTVDEKMEIIDIATSAEYRRFGVATVLLLAAKKYAKQLGKVGILLEVNENNIAAKNLYQKLGYKEIYVRKKYYAGKFDAIIMELMID